MAGLSDIPVRIRTEFRGVELLRDVMALLHRVRDAAGPIDASEEACQLIIRMDDAVKSEDVVVTASAAGGPFIPVTMRAQDAAGILDAGDTTSGSGDGSGVRGPEA